MNNEIPAHKDKIFLELDHKLKILEQEELYFLLNLGTNVNENGRTRNDVWRDRVTAEESMRSYLSQAYPNNTVADSMIATYDFIIADLKDRLAKRGFCWNRSQERSLRSRSSRGPYSIPVASGAGHLLLRVS